MPLDLTTTLNQYGFVGALANSIPELKTIFGQAAREEWPPERFSQAVKDSGWWKNNAESARMLATQSVTDPATYRQNLANAAGKIRLMASSMGYSVDDQGLAMHALIHNYDDQQIREAIGRQGQFGSWDGNSGLSAEAGQIQEHLKRVAQNYGVPYTEAWITSAVRHIQAGVDTIDGWESLVRGRAKAAFPQFAAQIDSGMTVRDIADPYISTMANTLEVAETDVDLSDRWVKQALSSRQPDGRIDTMPLWEFERKLKDDPRWDKTKQARTQAFETIAQVGRDFGLEA